MPMATKLGRVVLGRVVISTEDLPFITSHDPSIK